MSERSVCVTLDKVEILRESVVVSVEGVGQERVFLEEDMTRNGYWVGLVKFSEEHRPVNRYLDN